MQSYEHFKLMRDAANYAKTSGTSKYIPLNNCFVDYVTMYGERNETVICCYARNRIKTNENYVLLSKIEKNEPYTIFLEIYIHQNVLTKDNKIGEGWSKQLLSATIRNNYTPYNR